MHWHMRLWPQQPVVEQVFSGSVPVVLVSVDGTIHPAWCPRTCALASLRAVWVDNDKLTTVSCKRLVEREECLQHALP